MNLIHSDAPYSPLPARKAVGRPAVLPYYSGIYAIRCKVSGKSYVGSAISIGKRWNYHREDLRAQKHHSNKLQCAWNKYGEEAFEFLVLMACDQADLIRYEQAYIDAWQSATSRGYNMLPGAASAIGYRHSQEARSRMSAAAKSRVRKPLTEEQREASAARMRGTSFARGYKHTEESLAKMRISAARPRRKHKKNFSAEALAASSARMKAALATPEHRAKIAAGLRGKPKSVEHRKNSAEARKRYNADAASAIRAMVAAGGSSYRVVGEAFGCSAQTVCNIVRRRGVYAWT